MALTDDPTVLSVIGSNLEGTAEFFQHGLTVMASGNIVPEESAEVVLSAIQHGASSDEMSQLYTDAENVINRTAIEFTRLDTDPGSFFWVVIYRLRDEPTTVGYAVYSDETPLCETMDAEGLIEFVLPANMPVDARIEHFARKAPTLVEKIVKVAGYLPD